MVGKTSPWESGPHFVQLTPVLVRLVAIRNVDQDQFSDSGPRSNPSYVGRYHMSAPLSQTSIRVAEIILADNGLAIAEPVNHTFFGCCVQAEVRQIRNRIPRGFGQKSLTQFAE